MLTFHYAPDGQAAIDNLSQCLLQELQASKRVLWLLGGGSNIPLSVAVMAMLPATMEAQLTIALTDERYGEPGHADSNVRQLYDAGFNDGPARFIPVLQPSMSLEQTVATYATTLQAELETADVVVAQLGVGADGHICGILPGSPAVSEQQTVCGYNAGQFTRITMTPKAMQQIDTAMAFVFGSSKHDALMRLQHEQLDLATQPAQILKQLPEAHLYSDQVNELTTADNAPQSSNVTQERGE